MHGRIEAIAWGLVTAVAALVLAAATLMRPPPASDPADQEFSATRAFEHVAAIATEPRPIGSPSNGEVRNYLVEQLETMGIRAEQQTAEAPNYYGAPGARVEVVNVLGRIPGTQPGSDAVVVMAHYDTAPETPGANDNAVGVATVLEAARAVLALPPLANDVILLFTDGEEPAPRYGSPAFVAEHPWMADVVFVINLEALGATGPSLLVQTGAARAATVDLVVAGSSRPVTFSFLTDVVDLMGEVGTDFDPFLAADIEGAHFAYARDAAIYHTSADSVDRIDLRTLQHHGDNTLGLLREVGNLDLAVALPEGDGTFFTVAPSAVVRYSRAWGTPLAIGALVLASLAARRDLSGAAAGALRLALGALGTAIVATAVWLGLAAARPSMGWLESYGYVAAMVALAVAVRSRWRAGIPAPHGAVLLWALIAVVTSMVLPGAAYVFTWPAIAGAVVVLLSENRDLITRRLGRLALVIVTAVVVGPVVDVLVAMAQPRPGNPDSELTATFGLVAWLLVLALELTWRIGAQSRTGGADAAAPLQPSERRKEPAAASL